MSLELNTSTTTITELQINKS